MYNGLLLLLVVLLPLFPLDLVFPPGGFVLLTLSSPQTMNFLSSSCRSPRPLLCLLFLPADSTFFRSMPPRDESPYITLGIPSNSDEQAIKKAWVLFFDPVKLDYTFQSIGGTYPPSAYVNPLGSVCLLLITLDTPVSISCWPPFACSSPLDRIGEEVLTLL